MLVLRGFGYYCLPPNNQHPFGGARHIHRHLTAHSGPSSRRHLQLVRVYNLGVLRLPVDTEGTISSLLAPSRALCSLCMSAYSSNSMFSCAAAGDKRIQPPLPFPLSDLHTRMDT